MTGSAFAPSFPYLVLTDSGRLKLLDAYQIADADECRPAEQIRSLVGWLTTTTRLSTDEGALLVVHDEGALADTGLPDNPTARDVISALGGEDTRRGGLHVFCGVCPDGDLAPLTEEQVTLVSAAVHDALHPTVR